MKKKIIATVIAFVYILSLCGCGNTKLKDGSEVAFQTNKKQFSADKLYTEIKKKFGINVMIDMVDKEIFNRVYKDDEEIEKRANNQIETYKSQYGDSWDQTLKSAGYSNEKELKNELILSIQRQKAIEDYVKESIKESDLKEYYSKNTVGDISAKHILIKVDTSSENGLTADEAKEKAEKLIKKLNKGADFDELAKENSDDPGSKDKGGDLGYFNKGEMVKEFEDAAYALKVGEYIKEPVKTSYGYHIILKTGEKKVPKYKEIKDTISKKLATEKLENEKTLNVTALVETRKKYGFKIKDAKLKSEYKKYINKQLEAYEEQEQQQ